MTSTIEDIDVLEQILDDDAVCGSEDCERPVSCRVGYVQCGCATNFCNECASLLYEFVVMHTHLTTFRCGDHDIEFPVCLHNVYFRHI